MYHYDSHDVFILQVEGEKIWKIYEPRYDIPVRFKTGRKDIFSSKKNEINVGEISSKEIVLKEGDSMYIPRGYVHEARTTESNSLHLTIGMLTFTWYEVLLNTITQSLNDNLLMKTALPPEFAADAAVNVDNIVKELSESAKKIFTEEKIKSSLDDISDKFIYYENNFVNNKKQNEDININSTVKILPYILYKIKIKEDIIQLILPGKVLELPLKTKDMLGFIVRNKEFKVSDIETNLNDESKIIFVRHLLKNGFLCVCDQNGKY